MEYQEQVGDVRSWLGAAPEADPATAEAPVVMPPATQTPILSEEQIRHAVLLAVTTIGFPSMMRARAWVEDVLSKNDKS